MKKLLNISTSIFLCLTLVACNFDFSTTENSNTSDDSLRANDADDFALTSQVMADGGTLPVSYTCDGDSISPPLSWSGAPSETVSYALEMYHEDNSGDIHSYWVMYYIPAETSSLDSGELNVGQFGKNSVNGLRQYTPPCSQGPGQKSYTITLYALAEIPDVISDRDTLHAAIQGITLDSASMVVDYERLENTNNNFTIAQTLSDEAQRSTLAFSGLAMVTGNLEAQSFFPPGKVADYWGFQYLRDNDPDGMGHNTSFLTKVAYNVLSVLNDSQLEMLTTLASSQVSQINEYGYQRFPLMKAFRRLMDGDIPSGTTELNLTEIIAASRELYELDGQISYDRAVVFADIFRSMDWTQTDYLDEMKGKGWSSWPDVDETLIKEKLQSLSHDESVAVMTYAGDLYSWYAGSLEADIYFCPERQGTYYGSFYVKDAPAIGVEGYNIDEQLTATAGAALIDSSKGYVSSSQATLITSLVDIQRENLYAGTSNIVKARTDISTALRSLITTTEPSDDFKAAVLAEVLEKSAIYGELDGENNYYYANFFTQLYASLTDDQKAKLATLRESIMSGTYDDGTPFDFSVATTPFLYSAEITDTTVLDPYISNTDDLFGL